MSDLIGQNETCGTELLQRVPTSCDFEDFFSEILTSFHTTSTPSSVSMAKNAQSMPGTSRCVTYRCNTSDDINNSTVVGHNNYVSTRLRTGSEKKCGCAGGGMFPLGAKPYTKHWQCPWSQSSDITVCYQEPFTFFSTLAILHDTLSVTDLEPLAP